MIDPAVVRLVVLSAADATRSIQGLSEELGGHLQESDARSIPVRVPARQELARRSLVQARSLVLTDERVLDGDSALLVGSREVAGVVLGTVLVLS